ncbi:P-loop NTPase fold protein [Fusobacterium polymorphum]|uniref:P-loop NTPase fold protein n=1 Tax=Fusobacterium nucleatum subsp. polymorphum TaxID=76857 RepID=UPI003008F88A
MIIFNFLMSYIIFPLFFSSIIYIFATIEKHSYTKGIILILGILIFINYYFYKKIVMIIRKTYVNRINYYLSIILIFLTFFNIENFKEVIKIINQNIKNNFNQEIFLEIKNILNTVSYFYLFYFILLIGIIFLLTIIYNIFKNRKINKKVKENNEEIKLLSFRKKEKDKLKSMIENKKISSILIEAEIGNGKTTLINSLFKDLQNEEIIYLKLPLIKSVDELKRNLFLELQKIFLKNDLDNQFINAFLDNISAFKLGFLEINFGKKENMWNTIKKLQNTLKELDKNIIVVLDDIERENDANKIYESILFLGELSEYFRDTRTTTLLLVQYNYLKSKIKKDISSLEKYYKYKFKLNEPTAIEFLDEDYKLLIEEAILTLPKLSIDENFKDTFINSIIENINFFFNKISNKNTKLNIRSLEKSIQKIIYLYDFYKDSYITYSIFTYCILEENFQKIIDTYISQVFKENTILKKEIKDSILKNYCNNSLKDYSKSNIYTVFFKEIIDIISIYKKGEILIEKLDIQSNTIKEILNGNIEKPEIFSIKGYEEYIFNLIKGSSTKINSALENNLIVKKSELRKAINSVSEIFQPSEISIGKMKEILLKREYTQREIEEKEDKKDTISELLEISFNDSIKILEIHEEHSRKLDEDFNIFMQKISEIEDLKSVLSEIEKLLEEDKVQLKKEM